MRTVDLHCDTASRIYKSGGEYGLGRNPFCVDIEKLKSAGSLIQVFAAFVDAESDEKDGMSGFDYASGIIAGLKTELEKYPGDIRIAADFGDIDKSLSDGKAAAVISVEEGGIIGHSMEKLHALYDMGVRLITLSWNYPNSLSFPNCGFTYADRGLTDFGREVVGEMNRLGMVVDVSHMSDAGFYDVYHLSSVPFVASHSNSRELCGNARNLTDDMIRKIADKGGLIGINFCARFLGDGECGQISDMVKHIEHIRKVGGTDVIGIGSDFDGFDTETEIRDIGEIGKLAGELERHRFTGEEIEKIFCGNACRVLREIIG